MRLLEFLKVLDEDAPHPSALVNVNTPQFRNWFKNSKAVDEEGHPLVFYRGTAKVPKASGFASRKSAPSFVANADIASVYAAAYDKFGLSKTPYYQPGATVSPVFLSIQNPVDFSDYADETIDMERLFDVVKGTDWANPEDMQFIYRILKTLDVYEGKGIPFRYELPNLYLGSMDWEELIQQLRKHEAREDYEELSALLGLTEVDVYAIVDTRAFKEWVMARGYDGVVHHDVFEVGAKHAPSLIGRDVGGLSEELTHLTWRPFSAGQVKSIFNVGTWDPQAQSISEGVEDTERFRNYIRQKYGIGFDLRATQQGVVDLESIQAQKDSPPGTGSDAMRELVAWADQNGIMLTLQFGEKGYSPQDTGKRTTSKSRLEKFYRRFGFKPNKGRWKRYELSLYTNMYREPKIRESFRDETTIPNIDDIFDDPEYFRTAKRKEARVEHMSPDEYIKRALAGFNMIHKKQELPPISLKDLVSSRTPDLVDEYARAMQRGDKFPRLTLDYTGGYFSQEGLHRALAAKKAGIDQVPVVIATSVKESIAEQVSSKQLAVLNELASRDQNNGYQTWLQDTYDEDAAEILASSPQEQAEYFEQYLEEEHNIEVTEQGWLETGGWMDPSGESDHFFPGMDIVLYHFTSDALLPKIKEEGLHTGHGQKSNVYSTLAGVYLTMDSSYNSPPNRQYQVQAVDKWGGNPVRLTVIENFDELTPDPDDADIQSGRIQFITDYVNPRQIVSTGGEFGESLMEEKILQAAFFDPATNTVYPVGGRHQIQPLLAHNVPEETIKRILQEPNQGFVTTFGRWINRKQAANLGLDKVNHEMDSSEIPHAHDFDINIPVNSKLAWNI